jgi:hypothetical protein
LQAPHLGVFQIQGRRHCDFDVAAEVEVSKGKDLENIADNQAVLVAAEAEAANQDLILLIIIDPMQT